MIKVDQQRLHGDDTIGDCFLACVASVLEIPLEEVPYEITLAMDEEGVRWFHELEEFLETYDMRAEFLPQSRAPDDQYLIAGGQSPRFSDLRHAVVWKGGEVVHDPHPSRDGIVGEPVYLMEITDV